MKIKFYISIFLLFVFFVAAFRYSEDYEGKSYSAYSIVTQDTLDGNNIRSFFWNTGVYGQNLVISNTPGFEWPKGTGKYAIYTAGLTLGAYINNQLRLATASYKGEYTSGCCNNGVFYTDSRFRLFKVSKEDNQSTNADWLNWGFMVPYGAPFIDHNHNGVYEPFIDTPGVKGASQTLFVCMTDADPNTHSNSEGFSGGTSPLGAEVHLTAWCYDNSGYADMQFLKWVIINKNLYKWDSTVFSIVCDPDLGFASDDYIGCDTTRNLAFCYNATNNDEGNSYGYGVNPPAVGIMFLNCQNPLIKISSFKPFYSPSSQGGVCEKDPSIPSQSYWFMKGYKNDGTPNVIPYTDPPVITKFEYSGDPETFSGWTEYLGRVNNCDGLLTGPLFSPSPPGDRRFVMGYSPMSTIIPGDTQVVQICQLIARGTNNLNSVTKLKQLADVAKNLCENNFVIGLAQISTQLPTSFNLYQNFPNPFNPTTTIKFDVPLSKGGERTYGARGLSVKLTIYDAIGREIATLVNEQLNPGTYEVEWEASNYPSGVYFYRLVVGDNTNNGFTDDFSSTKKMVLLK